MLFDNPEQALCFMQHCIITGEEFAKLLHACAAPHEDGQLSERVVAGNRAILWVFYDTGIRVSELVNLRMEDFDRKHGLITVKGRGAKQRCIALGQNCLRNMLYYLDIHRFHATEIAEMNNLGEDHLFLTDGGQPMTKSDITLLFTMLKKQAGLTGKCIHPSCIRDTFAIRYLELSHDSISLQKLLGGEDMTMIKGYMQMSEASLRQENPIIFYDDHFPRILSGSRATRRRGFSCKE